VRSQVVSQYRWKIALTPLWQPMGDKCTKSRMAHCGPWEIRADRKLKRFQFVALSARSSGWTIHLNNEVIPLLMIPTMSALYGARKSTSEPRVARTISAAALLGFFNATTPASEPLNGGWVTLQLSPSVRAPQTESVVSDRQPFKEGQRACAP
jgi:hypothetical protein